MILDVTHEGDGVFKVWPPPQGKEIEEVIAYIKAQDPHNKHERDSILLFEELQEELEEEQERSGGLEFEHQQLEEKVESVVFDLRQLLDWKDSADFEEMKEKIKKAIEDLESAL